MFTSSSKLGFKNFLHVWFCLKIEKLGYNGRGGLIVMDCEEDNHNHEVYIIFDLFLLIFEGKLADASVIISFCATSIAEDIPTIE